MWLCTRLACSGDNTADIILPSRLCPLLPHHPRSLLQHHGKYYATLAVQQKKDIISLLDTDRMSKVGYTCSKVPALQEVLPYAQECIIHVYTSMSISLYISAAQGFMQREIPMCLRCSRNNLLEHFCTQAVTSRLALR